MLRNSFSAHYLTLAFRNVSVNQSGISLFGDASSRSHKLKDVSRLEHPVNIGVFNGSDF